MKKWRKMYAVLAGLWALLAVGYIYIAATGNNVVTWFGTTEYTTLGRVLMGVCAVLFVGMVLINVRDYRKESEIDGNAN